MQMTKESWDAMVQGQIRDRDRINDLQERLCKMALQVEKLSFQLEALAGWVVDESGDNWTVDSVLAGLDRDWGWNVGQRAL